MSRLTLRLVLVHLRAGEKRLALDKMILATNEQLREEMS